MQSVSTHAPLAGSDGHLVVDRHSVALFQPTLPLRGATVVLGLDSRGLWFQPTLPLRGATRPLGFFARLPRFNPRSPCGERQAARSSSRPSSCRFNPRSPCGDRPFAALLWRVTPRFNPRSPCGERLDDDPAWDEIREVSTHAPLAGSDNRVLVGSFDASSFQPTLPLRGATRVEKHLARLLVVSTHAPLAGSDVCAGLVDPLPLVSTHAPLAGSDMLERALAILKEVSTHAPLAGSDAFHSFGDILARKFQPTLPLRGATSATSCSTARGIRFNPRSPCGERLARPT